MSINNCNLFNSSFLKFLSYNNENFVYVAENSLTYFCLQSTKNAASTCSLILETYV